MNVRNDKNAQTYDKEAIEQLKLFDKLGHLYW